MSHQSDIEQYPLIYHIDIPRVQRILRPLSAKILGLQRDLQSAPSTVSSKTSLNLSSDGGREEQEININEVSPISIRSSRHSSLSPARQHLDSRIKYGRRCKRDTFKRHSLDNFHESYCSSSIYESLEIWRGLTLPVLLRRHSDSIRDCVKDAVERLWWKPLFQNTLHIKGDLQSLRLPRIQSLAVTAAYALGGWIEENLGLLDGVAANEELERIFEEIPSHLRRHVVLEHIANLCKRIPIVELLEPIVEIFAKSRANSQAFNLLSHILLSQLQPSRDIASVYESKFNIHQNGVRNIALSWMYSISRITHSSDKFIHLLCNNLSLELAKRHRFFHFVTTTLPMRHAAPLMKIAANLILTELRRKVQTLRRQPLETNRALLQTFIIQRARLKSWMKILIEHSALLRVGRQVNEIATLCDETILHMVTDLMAVSKALPHIFGDMAMTACLHGFNLSSKPKSYGEMDSTTNWLRRIQELRISYFAVLSLPATNICSTHNGDEQQISLSLIISSYKSLTCLYELSKLLESNGEYEICRRLLEEIIADYEILRQNDVILEQQSNFIACTITIHDLEDMVLSIESLIVVKDIDKVGEWQYEPGLEEWVLLKPHSSSLAPNKRMPPTELDILVSNQLPISSFSARNLDTKRLKYEVQLERNYRTSQQFDQRIEDHKNRNCDDDHIFNFCDPVKIFDLSK